MDKANEEVLRECAVDYYNALIAKRKADAALHQTLSTVKSNLCANKMYDTYHVHISGNRYIIFEYEIKMEDKNQFKNIRSSLGFTQESLSEELDCSIETIRNWEQGRTRIPKVAVLWLVAEAKLHNMKQLLH